MLTATHLKLPLLFAFFPNTSTLLFNDSLRQMFLVSVMSPHIVGAFSATLDCPQKDDQCPVRITLLSDELLYNPTIVDALVLIMSNLHEVCEELHSVPQYMLKTMIEVACLAAQIEAELESSHYKEFAGRILRCKFLPLFESVKEVSACVLVFSGAAEQEIESNAQDILLWITQSVIKKGSTPVALEAFLLTHIQCFRNLKSQQISEIVAAVRVAGTGWNQVGEYSWQCGTAHYDVFQAQVSVLDNETRIGFPASLQGIPEVKDIVGKINSQLVCTHLGDAMQLHHHDTLGIRKHEECKRGDVLQAVHCGCLERFEVVGGVFVPVETSNPRQSSFQVAGNATWNISAVMVEAETRKELVYVPSLLLAAYLPYSLLHHQTFWLDSSSNEILSKPPFFSDDDSIEIRICTETGIIFRDSFVLDSKPPPKYLQTISRFRRASAILFWKLDGELTLIEIPSLKLQFMLHSNGRFAFAENPDLSLVFDAGPTFSCLSGLKEYMLLHNNAKRGICTCRSGRRIQYCTNGRNPNHAATPDTRSRFLFIRGQVECQGLSWGI